MGHLGRHHGHLLQREDTVLRGGGDLDVAVGNAPVGEYLIDDDAETPDVGLGRVDAAGEGFGGQPPDGHLGQLVLPVRHPEQGQPEVADLARAAVEKHVAGGQVPVDDLLLLEVGHAVDDLQTEGLPGLWRDVLVLIHPREQTASGGPLHDDHDRLPLRGHPVQPDDVPVLQLQHHVGLAQERGP